MNSRNDKPGWLTALCIVLAVGSAHAQGMRQDRPTLRVLSAALCVSFAVLIGASRVYLGVHYLSDVIAGFAAAFCWIAICLAATEGWVRWRDWRSARRARRAQRA